MKKQFILIATIVLISNVIYSQSADAAKLEIVAPGSFAKPKIIPNMDKLALAQITINYKLTSTEKTTAKSNTGKKAGAKISAYLETTDGKLSDNDFQEITDYFYTYFQKKLKENGIDTIAWNTITGTDFYKDGDEESNKDKKEKSENVWVTSTAHGGNKLYGGGIAFAFGKIKKASRFCEQIGAPAGFFHLTVDFADLMIDLDITTKTSGSYYYSTTITKKTYKWAVNPIMSVTPFIPSLLGGNNSLFWNEKSQSESLWLRKDIESEVKYANAANEDASKLKNNLWAFSKEMTPVVVETTMEKYKAAAKNALEKYADAFITKSKGGK